MIQSLILNYLIPFTFIKVSFILTKLFLLRFSSLETSFVITLISQTTLLFYYEIILIAQTIKINNKCKNLTLLILLS